MHVAPGEDYELPLKFENSDGSAYSLAGCGITVTVKEGRLSSSDNVWTPKTIGSGVTVTDEDGGLATCLFPEADTALMTPGKTYYWDVWLTTSGGLDKQVVRLGKLIAEYYAGDP